LFFEFFTIKPSQSPYNGLRKRFGQTASFQILVTIESNATTKNAIPVQNRSPPVMKYTMIATIIAGISTRNSFMRIIIIKPIMINTMRKGMLKAPSPMLLRIERKLLAET